MCIRLLKKINKERKKERNIHRNRKKKKENQYLSECGLVQLINNRASKVSPDFNNFLHRPSMFVGVSRGIRQ